MREQRVKAARYLVKINPKEYYLTYGGLGDELYVWQRTGGILDWLIDII